MPMHRLTVSLFALAAAGALAAVSGPPAEPWPPQPGDTPRQAQRDCTGPTTWTQVVGGTVDGVMARSPIGYAAWAHTWQPNREVSVANLGTTPVRNPRVIVNNARDWGTPEAIVSEACRGFERQADRARALWEFQRRRRFHACTWDAEVDDPVKALNVYGYTLCGDDAIVLSELWTVAGLATRHGYPVGHSVAEAWYDGLWHLLDGDEHCLFLLRDNETIAPEAEVVRDHDLVKRTHTYGILSGDSRDTDQFSASLYGYRGVRRPEPLRSPSRHTLDWSLPPGATMTWRWSHLGKQYSAGDTSVTRMAKDGDGDLRLGWGPDAYRLIANAQFVYEPDLAAAHGRLCLVEATNLAPPAEGGLTAADPARPAVATFGLSLPYVLVGGALTAAAQGGELLVSTASDGKTYQPVPATAGQPLEVSLDDRLSPRRQPHYRVWVRVELRGGARLARLRLALDLQTSQLALPELELGDNRVEYRDAGDGPRLVRVTQSWVERSAWSRPTAPARALAPAAGATVDGTAVRFEWSPAECDGGVADYHFELSEWPDLRWPLSPNFEKLLSRTAQRGTTSYQTPYVGLLNPGRPYYWRVRAQSRQGVWGPWSAIWSFRCTAPGVPLHVRCEPSPDGRRVELRWAPNPQGARPVSYRIYGSDEQGFTASDEPQRVDFGYGFCRTMDEYQAREKDKSWQRYVQWPANHVAETKATALPVAGVGLTEPGRNLACYRVVAVDEQGRRSGPSDLAEVPRPLIVTAPPSSAVKGQAFEYRPRTVASIGHLTCRTSYTPAFWEREMPRWRLVRGPDWLRLDADSGLLSGQPTGGESAVEIDVTTPAGVARQSFNLGVK